MGKTVISKLNKVEMERLVKEATRQRTEEEGGCEEFTGAYAYNMRNTAKDEKLAGKLNPVDKQEIEKAIDEAIEWLDRNQLAKVEEFEDKQKKLEGICNPIIAQMYQGGAIGRSNGFGNASSGSAGAVPKIEEVD